MLLFPLHSSPNKRINCYINHQWWKIQPFTSEMPVPWKSWGETTIFFRKVGNSDWNTILWPGRGCAYIFQGLGSLPFFEKWWLSLADFQGLCKNFYKALFLYKKTLESLESIGKHPNKFLKLCKKHVKSGGPFFAGIINNNFLKKNRQFQTLWESSTNSSISFAIFGHPFTRPWQAWRSLGHRVRSRTKRFSRQPVV